GCADSGGGSSSRGGGRTSSGTARSSRAWGSGAEGSEGGLGPPSLVDGRSARTGNEGTRERQARWPVISRGPRTPMLRQRVNRGPPLTTGGKVSPPEAPWTRSHESRREHAPGVVQGGQGMIRSSKTIGGTDLVAETGKLAKQADGAC